MDVKHAVLAQGVMEELARARGMKLGCPSTEDLVHLGQELWPATYGSYEEDSKAFEGLVKAAENSMYLMAAVAIPSEQIVTTWACRWYDQGLPAVKLGHKYAAALMATSMGSDIAEYVRPPWRAWLIHLPVGLLTTKERDKAVNINRVVVQCVRTTAGEDRYQWSALTDGYSALWSHGNTIESLLENPVGDAWEGTCFQVKDTEDERTSALIGRLIVGVCLGFSDPSNITPQGPKARNYPHTEVRKSKEPTVRTFMLGKQVKVDCRQAVKDYVAGTTGNKLSVQVLVRGHWKSQPHGPKQSLRKVIWREPFWRGPEDAPILVNSKKKGED